MRKKLLQLLKGQLALWISTGSTDRQLWIFSSTNNTEFNYNSKYLFLYVKEHFPQVKPRYVVNEPKLRAELSKKYGAEYFIETQTLAGMKQALRAGVWFTSAGLPVYAFGSGRKRTIVNLWHGVPLKKIALLEEHASTLSKLYFRQVFSKNYKYILTTSTELVPIMAASFGVKEDKIKVWGQPRNDVILETKDKSLKDICGKLPAYRKAILYAPTYRENGEAKLFPFSDVDRKRLEGFLKEKELLLCLRTHLEEKELCTSYTAERVIDVGANVIDDISEYLSCFDVLITDYSSIYIDYLLLDRPMIFLPYDKEEYLSVRGMNFKYEEVTPGEQPETFADFLKALEHALYADTFAGERKRVNSRFNEVQKPCCQYICETIYEMEEQ